MEEGIEVISDIRKYKVVNANKEILVHMEIHNMVDSLTILVQVQTN